MRNLMETNPKMPMAPATIEDCSFTMGNTKFLETPMGTLLMMELLVIFTAILLVFLALFGSLRRTCNNDKFRHVVFAAETLSTYLLTYAVGFMHDAPFRSDLFPIWAMFLMLILGDADVSAHSLEDNEHWKSHRWQLGAKSVWMLALIVFYVRNSSGAVTATVCIGLILSAKYEERAQAMMAASRHSLERNAKVVADYMSAEHESGGGSCGEVDPLSMRGYTYLVRAEEEGWWNNFLLAKRFIERRLGKEEEAAPARDDRMTLDKDKLTTIEKVWKCKGSLLSSQGDPHNKLKDKCLSFALFKLLRLRYAGYSLPQKAHENTWKLIRHILLSQEDGHKRAFQVIEVELTFLFDFFYTRYSSILRPVWLLKKLMESASVVIGIWATKSLLKHYKRNNSNCRLATLPNGLTVDMLVTSLMIISFVIVKLIQSYLVSFSEWTRVILICQYVQNESWQKKVWIEKMIRTICGVPLLNPWERQLRQYSFLEGYLYKPFSLLNNAFMAGYIDQTRDGQRKSKPIPLHKEVKKAVFDALKWHYGTKLENGQASLRANYESQQLLWACQLETQTQVIMVWHIATSFCEYQLPVGRSDLDATRSSFLVATSLSKYLAYLVAFAPRLLPGHPYDTEYVFDQAIIEARDFFQGCNSLDDMVTKMERKGRGSSAREKTVIKPGAALGNQLVHEIEDKDKIWKILADFWVELMLYVAPSDDVKAHAEHLTRGGEFVTHLWALLSHAGIERDHPGV